MFHLVCFYKTSSLPVAGEDADDENGDVDERDEVTQGQCGPVASHLCKVGLFVEVRSF